MPSASTANDPYDNDALERDLIDPDDGELPISAMRCAMIRREYRNGTGYSVHLLPMQFTEAWIDGVVARVHC